jgi:hypothetical protein
LNLAILTGLGNSENYENGKNSIFNETHVNDFGILLVMKTGKNYQYLPDWFLTHQPWILILILHHFVLYFVISCHLLQHRLFATYYQIEIIKFEKEFMSRKF